jgi:hypothetical protein
MRGMGGYVNHCSENKADFCFRAEGRLARLSKSVVNRFRVGARVEVGLDVEAEIQLRRRAKLG